MTIDLTNDSHKSLSEESEDSKDQNSKIHKNHVFFVDSEPVRTWNGSYSDAE